MKTIGILGGMSWESTLEYYRVLNTSVKERLGGLASAKCLLYSVNFGEVEAWLAKGEWDKIAEELGGAAKRLETAGADLMIIATNTMHHVAGQVAAGLGIPLVHIADASADALSAAGLATVGLLGTKPTMEMDFYRKKLEARGFTVLTPEADDRTLMHRIIFEELCLGRVTEESRRLGLAIMDRLAARGAEGMLLACTELGLLFRPQDTPIPLFDTALIHARAAANLALA